MPIHDIIDNRQEKLVDHIRRILPGSQAAKFAVGYFFLSGLEAVAGQLANVHDLRLLIGNTSNRETIEQMAEGYRRLEQVRDAAEALAYPKRTEMALAADRTAANIGQAAALMDQTDEAEQLVGALAGLIEEGRLKVRVHTRGRLHAKAYIFDYGPVYDAQAPSPPRGGGHRRGGLEQFYAVGRHIEHRAQRRRPRQRQPRRAERSITVPELGPASGGGARWQKRAMAEIGYRMWSRRGKGVTTDALRYSCSMRIKPCVEN